MQANTLKLRDWLRRERGVDLADYDALWRWSVGQVSDFWQALWDYFDLQSPTPHTRALGAATMPEARWFEGAQVNYVAQLLRHGPRSDAAGAPALVFRNERLQQQGVSQEMSWAELEGQVGALAATLRGLGVGPGDRVAAYLPNIPQAAIGFLACASLGAVWSLCAPDMGVGTVRDRFKQIDPKVLIAADGTVYGGKTIDRRDTVAQLLLDMPSIEALVFVPYLEASSGAGAPPLDTSAWAGHRLAWGDALATPERVAPVPLPFAHPLWIVYSSGTTGLPKPIVHGHGGVILEMLKLHHLHLNLHASADAEERFHWTSSSGWVMWNLALSALLLGTTVCLYDGHPSHPAPDTLWRYVSDVRATFLGAGAAYYTGCLKTGVVPRAGKDLSRLRALGSTGSPLPPEAYAWGYEQLGPELWWAVISGGTDLASAFLAGSPELPTIPGEMQARALGAHIEAWDEAGRPVVDDVGELVCLQAMPSMPVFFWGDVGHKRYLESYFDHYPGVWRHGDWLRITPSGSTVVYGRSDATLNRHGHRLGTAELYRVVEAMPEVMDSLVVDIEYLGRPSFMPLFVVLRDGLRLDASLEAAIRQRIREGLSPRFVPDAVVQVAEVPRTLTGKKQELPVKKLMLGRALHEVVNRDACANPQSFDWYVNYARQNTCAA